MVGERFKDRPSYCVNDHHALLVKGGYIKQVSNGVYSLNPIMTKMVNNIESIIRKELEFVGAQEVVLSSFAPIDLLKESNREDEKAFKFTDRDNIEFANIKGAQELAIQLVRDSSNSYANYPFAIYQNKVEFIKGQKPSGGLINLKESIYNQMYSFHTSTESLDSKYEEYIKAYENIFKKCGLETYMVNDSYDNSSHKQVVLSDIGEDKFVICDSCAYKASFDKATGHVENSEKSEKRELELVVTPDVTTIAKLADFLAVDVKKLCKSVAYQKYTDGSFVVGFIRGDLDINQAKLTNLVGDELYTAELSEDSILSGGFIGPYQMPKEVEVYFDKSLMGIEDLVIGANQFDKHYIGFNVERDFGNVEYVDLADVRDDDICPICSNKTLKVKNGVEIACLSKSDDQMTKNMSMQYLDVDGNNKNPIMGLYKIDIIRLAAMVCEMNHDDYGPIWPMTIAPWKVQICCLRCDDEECRKYADELYNKLIESGVEVLYDDRKVRPGSMFSDADLFGCPLRVVVSPRNMKNSCVEIASRDKSYLNKPSLDEAFDDIIKFLSR